MEEILNPNCSEIVWKLNIPINTKEDIIKALENKEEEYPTTYMAGGFPDKFLGVMINCLKEEEKNGCDLSDIKLKMVSNDNGENWDFIKEGFKLAKLYLNNGIDEDEAELLLERFFDENDDEE